MPPNNVPRVGARAREVAATAQRHPLHVVGSPGKNQYRWGGSRFLGFFAGRKGPTVARTVAPKPS